MQNSTLDFQSLAARVERLEGQYHWFKSEVVTEKLVLMDAHREFSDEKIQNIAIIS